MTIIDRIKTLWIFDARAHHAGHRPTAAPSRTPRPSAPPAPVDTPTVVLGVRRGPLPIEAQIMLRVIGEDLPGARQLLRTMPGLDRGILMFYMEQIAGLVYEVDETES
jgi:hypothetical protein